VLDKLFPSKAKVEILKVFLFNPDNSFYQRQISHLTHQSIRGVQRELEKLQEIGLVNGSRQGNRMYYKTNRKCSIFEELKNIFFKATGIADALKNNFKGKDIKIAFIYGSYARGDEDFSSDVDLMIVGSISSRELSAILSEPKRKLMREINYAIFSLQEFAKRKKQKDHFIESVLKDKKIFIVGDKNELKALIRPPETNKA